MIEDTEKKTQIERTYWVRTATGWRRKTELLSPRAYAATFSERSGFHRGAKINAVRKP